MHLVWLAATSKCDKNDFQPPALPVNSINFRGPSSFHVPWERLKASRVALATKQGYVKLHFLPVEATKAESMASG